jgi:hypothetical protein
VHPEPRSVSVLLGQERRVPVRSPSDLGST